jgi:hypothetical protein
LAKEEATKAEEEARLLAEEEARIAEEALLAEEEARIAEEALLAEEARLAKEEATKAEEEARLLAEEEARIAEEARLEEEDRLAEQESLQEELRLAQADVSLEEARLAEGKQKAEEAAADQYEDEWEAAVELAQQGLEGKIVGIDDAVMDDSAKADWDAAGLLAQELQTGVAEDYDDDEEEMDLETLSRAAKGAMKEFEKELKASEAAKRDQRNGWAAEMVSDTDSTSDSDMEEFPEGDLEEIARAAREAVKLMGDDVEDYDDETESFEGFEFQPQSATTAAAPPVLRNWSKVTVADLKDVLKSRGLKSYGKKADMVDRLEVYDAEQLGAVYQEEEEEETVASEYDTSSSDMMDFDMENVDLEELGRQARAAVEASSAIAEGDSSSDFDLEDVDMEELGRQARAAVEASSPIAEDDSSSDFDLDDVDMEELGRQARAAVEASSKIAEGDSSSDEWLFDEGTVDLKELGAQARAAVDASFADEPSDEVLKQLESEEKLLFEVVPEKQNNIESMTVAQLKEELRSRGLRLTGKKAELIERLQSA